MCPTTDSRPAGGEGAHHNRDLWMGVNVMAKRRQSVPIFSRTCLQQKLQATLAVLVLAWASPAAGLAQEAGCTYDLCALRMSGREVRRGTADERVDGFSFWGGAPNLPMLSERGDSAGINYEAFRKLNNRGNSIQKVGVVLALTGLIVTVADQDNIGWGMGLGFAAYVPMFWGASYHRRAQDRLNRAIWWYNRDL